MFSRRITSRVVSHRTFFYFFKTLQLNGIFSKKTLCETTVRAGNQYKEISFRFFSLQKQTDPVCIINAIHSVNNSTEKEKNSPVAVESSMLVQVSDVYCINTLWSSALTVSAKDPFKPANNQKETIILKLRSFGRPFTFVIVCSTSTDYTR